MVSQLIRLLLILNYAHDSEKVDLNQDTFSSKVEAIFQMDENKKAHLKMMQTLAPSVLQMRWGSFLTR